MPSPHSSPGSHSVFLWKPPLPAQKHSVVVTLAFGHGAVHVLLPSHQLPGSHSPPRPQRHAPPAGTTFPSVGHVGCFEHVPAAEHVAPSGHSPCASGPQGHPPFGAASPGVHCGVHVPPPRMSHQLPGTHDGPVADGPHGQLFLTVPGVLGHSAVHVLVAMSHQLPAVHRLVAAAPHGHSEATMPLLAHADAHLPSPNSGSWHQRPAVHSSR